MEVTIKGTEKEIADLVVLLQNQRLVRMPYTDKFTVGASATDLNSAQQCKVSKRP